ncbi:MAG: aldo/keto reductase [Anaerolineaceae bacterium]|nr:aldo/keto reductase [Anaerolineaceae bacterium]MCB9101316.1 aldo/keto reductase [Anaerolineales bacterium]
MTTRRLGATDLLVSPLGLGLAALGRPGYINLGHAADLNHNYDIEMMEQHTHQLLDAAWAQGVRYFDVARSYGRAEPFLGSWLKSRRISPNTVTIGSKWGYTYTANWQVEADKHEIKDHSLPVLQRQWQESQANLNSFLNIYQIHSATLDSGVLENEPVLLALARLKQFGIAIGLSLSGPQQGEVLKRAMDIEIDGQRLFDTVQATWNVLEPSAGSTLQLAADQGLGVIVKEALANGRLTSRNDNPAFAAKRAVLETQARRLETTIDALALAAVLAQPWVGVVLSGAATIDQLTANLKALHVAWDDQAAAALAALVEPPEVYWQTRSALDWN